MATVYSAKIEASFSYRCSACGFHGTGRAAGQSATSSRSREGAEQSARDAARDAIMMAACPKCGRRDERQVERVRGEALSHGGLLALGVFVVSAFLGWARFHAVIPWAIFGAVAGALSFGLVMYFRFGGRLREADRAVIEGDDDDDDDSRDSDEGGDEATVLRSKRRASQTR